MLDINISDVVAILQLCVPYLVFLGIVLVLAIVTMVICRKMTNAKKILIRREAGVAILLAVVIAVNLICFGPMSTLLSLATGHGVITEETSNEAQEFCTDIAEEGIVLLKNDGLLPLKQSSNLNVFGWASTNPCYGGTGSGALSGSYPTVSLLDGLENAGFNLNTELTAFYTSYRAEHPTIGMFEQDYTLPEPTADSYSTELLENAKSFSDTAVVVISRIGGEGFDLPNNMSGVKYTNNSTEYEDFPAGSHYLELSQTERNMINLVCSEFDNVILVCNSANTFELNFADGYKQIKSVIWCPGPGQTGFNALGEILNGEINPSGKTVDTFTTDFTAAPYINNIGAFTYDNMSEFATDGYAGSQTIPAFVNYVEGIYVGYRFYETAAEEGLINYDNAVQYPFGYGLSYTTFTQEMGTPSVDSDGNISFDVTVTNTGSVAGKDVVQVYYNPPYYNGGIEKSSVNLVAFDKTDLLDPGASQTLTISFKTEDMASFDTYGEGCYVLEAGDYGISIRSDSHTILNEKTFTVDKTIVYNESNKRSTDEEAAVTQFADVEGGLTYLSRQDGFANYSSATEAPSMTMGDDQKAGFINLSNYDASAYNDSNDVMPTTGADNGMTLADMRGLDYDDSAWDTLLDQLTISDMNTLIALGGYQTHAISSVGKVATVDCDGPASINNNFTGVGSIGFPSAVLIAATWNEDVAQGFGEKIGKMADEMDVSGWYAPGMNIHRSPFAGRNFEYYSEDGFLSGKMAANAVIGAEKYGVYAYIKHYALNDQETNRGSMICTWTSEQAMREIYLKPFELSVKEGDAKAVMVSNGYIGAVWAGGSNALCNIVLRDEWGFEGFTLTDAFIGGGFMNSDQGIRNGTNCCLVAYDAGANYVADTTSATSVLAMRQSCKNIMYTVVNSRAYATDTAQSGLESWKIMIISIDVVLLACFAALEYFVIYKGYKKKKNVTLD